MKRSGLKRATPKPPVERACATCGEVFTVGAAAARRGEGKYCSRVCWPPRRMVAATCLGCGKEFEIEPRRVRESGNYCSHSCSSSFADRGYNGEAHHWWKQTAIVRRPPAPCIACGREMKLKKNGLCGTCDRKGMAAWRAGVGKARCAMCGSKVNVQGHHIVPKRRLREEGRGWAMWDTRNRLWLCAEPSPERCHMRHELAHRRVPRDMLPLGAEEFAAEHGLGWVLDREYGVRPEAV